MDRTASSEAHHNCEALHELVGRVGDRWSLRVMLNIQGAPMRFNELRRATPGVSQQMLTRTLRTLERDGMVVRTVHPSVPPQVEYALTTMGASLADQGKQLGEWAAAHLAQIDAARGAFDERATTRG